MSAPQPRLSGLSVASGSARADRVRLATTVLLGVSLLATAALLRLTLLGSRDIFRDEAASWLLASYRWDEIVPRMSFEPYPPLYPFLLKAWVSLFGDGLATMRDLSALAGIATVVSTWAWARQALGRWPALLAAGVVTLSPLAVSESRLVRMYAFETLFATLAWWLLWRLLARPHSASRRTRLVHVGLAAAAVGGELWTMPTGIAVAGLQAIVVVLAALPAWNPSNTRPSAALAAAALLIGVASFVPWIPAQAASVAGGTPSWVPPPTIASLWQATSDLVGGWQVLPALLLVPILLCLALAGLVGLLRAADPGARLTAVTLIAGISLVPVWWLASFVHSAFDVRYLGAAIPPLALAVATGTVWLWRLGRRGLARNVGPRGVIAVGAGALILAAAWFIGDWTADRGVIVAGAAASRLEARLQPGDVVLAVDARTYFLVAYELAHPRRTDMPRVALWYWRSGMEPRFVGIGLIADRLSIRPADALRDGRLTLPGLSSDGSIWIPPSTMARMSSATSRPLRTDRSALSRRSRRTELTLP